VVVALPDKTREAREEALVAALQSQTAGTTVAAWPAAGVALPDPQGPAPQGRYERLSVDGLTLYASGAPLVILASALLKDTQSGAVVAQAKFKSISDKPLAAVVVDLHAKDITGEQLQGLDNFQYLDLAAGRGVVFGIETPAYLPDARTRGLAVCVRKAVFADGSSWDATAETYWEPVFPQQELTDVFGSWELAGQYCRDTNEQAKFAPVESSDLWFCACGEINHAGEEACHSCDLSLEQAMRSLEQAGLESRLAQFEEARRCEEEERRKKAIRTGTIVAGIAVVLVAALSVFFGVVMPAAVRAEAERAQSEAERTRVEAERRLENPSVGDTVYFGDIYWRVLDVQGRQALLISKDALESRPYNESAAAATWETCSLRAYLNGEFLNTHFSTEEQGRIVLSTVANDNNPEYDTPGGSDTEDKVFLLSIDEAERYFASDYDRSADGSYGTSAWWWLRSPGGALSRAASVNYGGSVDSYGDDVNLDRLVRPALWINTGANAQTFADTTGSNALQAPDGGGATLQPDYPAVLQGDFFSVAGRYVNAQGETTELNKDGQFGDGDVDWMVDGIQQDEDGRISWSIRPIDGGPGGFAVQLYPVGIPVEWSSPSSDTYDDRSRIRLYAGHTLPNDGDSVFYREP
jgi:hypothetical protein